MDILTTVMQLFGNFAGEAAQATAPAVESAANLGGVSGLINLLCQILGIGC